MKLHTLALAALIALAGPAFAQEAGASAGGDAQALAKQLSNPIAALISVPLQSNYDWGLGPTGDGYQWRQRAPLVMAIIIEGPPQGNVWSFTPVRSGKETLRLELVKPGVAEAKRTFTYEVEVP